MAHESQIEFMLSVKAKFPERFSGCRVLDIGSLDLNGNNRYLFENYKYLGVDVGYGDNVDIVCPGHKIIDKERFDIVISTECLEHDCYWEETLNNMVLLTKPNGLLLLSCATTGRPEHGTKRTSPLDSPFTNDYYKNITINDLNDAVNITGVFKEYEIKTISSPSCDLYFWGIKR